MSHQTSRLGSVLQRPATYGIVKAGDFQRSGVPMLRSGDIRDGRIGYDMPYVTKEKSEEFARTVLQKGDVVVALVGYPGDSAVVPDRLAGANISRAVGLLRPGRRLLPDYLAHYLNSAVGRAEFLKPSAGSAQIVVNLADLNKLEIPLPEIDEQRRIAGTLGDIGAEIAAVEGLIAKKCAIKQGLIQAIFGDSYPRTGMETLGKYLTRPPRYGIGAAAVSYQPALPSYIRITDIDDDGRFSPRPRVSVNSPLSGNYKLMVGDLVIARTGASVGKSYRYRVEDGELVFAGFLIAIHPDERRLDPRYLAYILQSKAYWDWVASESTRSGQPGINAHQLSQFPIGLPTIEDQREFAQKLADADTEIEALERRLEATRAIKEGMMQELLSGWTRLEAEATA